MAILAQAARLLAKSTAIVGYRGVGRLFKPLRRVAALRRVTGEVPLGGTRRIRFGAFDYYWAGFLWTGKPYEEDVQRVFDRLAHIPDKLFVDGGANIGYWTVKLSEPGYGYRRFIAVEANPEVFTYLQRNMALNAVDGIAVHAAIAERAGEIVHLGGAADHASASVGAEGLPVTTASVASLLRGGGTFPRARPRSSSSMWKVARSPRYAGRKAGMASTSSSFSRTGRAAE